MKRMNNERIAIAGGPKTGKTSLAVEMRCAGANVSHSDTLLELPWSEQSLVVSRWFNHEAPWVVEGVTVVRALRKWLERNPEGKPCDRVIYLREPRILLSTGQERMSKACWTVWREIRRELERRGVVLDIR